MRKLQNMLYITTQGSYLHKGRETLVMEQECKKVVQLLVHGIGLFFVSATCWCRLFDGVLQQKQCESGFY